MQTDSSQTTRFYTQTKQELIAFFVSQHFITEQQEEEISSKPLDILLETVLSLPNVETQAVTQALSNIFEIQYIPFDRQCFIPASTLMQANLNYFEHNNCVLLKGESTDLMLASATPWNEQLLSDISHFLKVDQLDIAFALTKTVQQYLGLSAQQTENDANEIMTILNSQSDTDKQLESDQDAEITDNAPTIVRLVDSILAEGISSSASDIHIDGNLPEPTQIRFRVDGTCYTHINLPAQYHLAILSRIKILAKLDIAEKRLPQDGKFSYSHNNINIEVRVATIATVKGESAILRVLNPTMGLSIEQIHLSDQNLANLRKLLTIQHGIFLVVGPTGSGKTTSLHALIDYLNQGEQTIWTIEDPVEITQDGIQQVQAHNKIGLTFAHALRAFLRADPDIILVGEMRDYETAKTAFEAALTGHLVLSTLHTHSAPETITRLLDLDIAPINIADACIGILAQRLVKTLCTHCKVPDTLTAHEETYLQSLMHQLTGPSGLQQIYKKRGCDHCRQTGYRGRIPIHELMIIDQKMKELIQNKANSAQIEQHATQQGMRTLLTDALTKLLSGEIDFEHVKRLHHGISD